MEEIQIHDLGSNGIENQPYSAAEPQYFVGNTVTNVGVDGLTVILYDPNFYNAPTPKLKIANNTVTNAHRHGVTTLARDGCIHDNHIYDTGMPSTLGCGIALIGMEFGTNGVWEIPRTLASKTTRSRRNGHHTVRHRGVHSGTGGRYGQ